MAKIVSFTKPPTPSSNRSRGRALDGFFDDGDLLEFSRTENAQAQAHDWAHDQALTGIPTQPHPTSIFASDWSNQELADLYRAYSLIQSAQPGLECDRGVSDEGDPWFLIGDDKGDVLVHICRIEGTYILDSVALPKPLRGANFNTLIEDFLTTVVGKQAHDAESVHEPANVVRLDRSRTVCLHPSMMIAALVWTLLMNADELSLPLAKDAEDTGQSQKGLGLDTDQGGSQDRALPGNFPGDESPYNADTAGLPDKPDTGRVDAFGDVSTAAVLSSQAPQKDEKQLHFSAYSNALTTIAIAAGFYASAEASDAFWKSTQEPADTAVSFGETGDNGTHVSIAPLKQLSDALALLGSVVDKVVFQNHDDYETEGRSAGKATTDDPAPVAIETVEASIGQQMLTIASEVLDNLAESSQANGADSAAAVIEKSTAGQPRMAASLYDKNLAFKSQEKGPDATVQDIAQDYTSDDADISRYDASSFNAGLGKYGGELDKYTDIAGDISSARETEDTDAREAAAPSSDTTETPSVSSSLDPFDEAARNFINSKMANADLEILVFANEIIFVDTAAFSAANTTVSWQLEDGGVVSMIGLSSDMAEFLVA
jgi:hypothetical protein